MVVLETGSSCSSAPEVAMLPFVPLEDLWDQEMEVFRSGSASDSASGSVSGIEVSVVGGTGWKSAALCPGRSWPGGRAGVPSKPPTPFPGGPDL